MSATENRPAAKPGPRDRLRQKMVDGFCEVLGETGLPPMTVLRLAAEAFGSVYREVADAHRGSEACPCGWRPDEARDVEVLRKAMQAACSRAPVPDLVSMRPRGNA